MTEKQKQAVSLLNRLKDNISEEEYFLLLDFVVGKNNPVYVPYYPTYPYITWDSKPLPVTCNDNNGNLSISGDLTFKEERK